MGEELWQKSAVDPAAGIHRGCPRPSTAIPCQSQFALRSHAMVTDTRYILASSSWLTGQPVS